MASLPVAAGEAVPETVLPLCHHRGVSAPRKSAKGIGPWGLCPQTPEVYRLFLRGSATGIGFRTAKRNEKERYRMASPPRKPAGARVAPQRCPILRLLTVIVYHLLPLFSTVQYSIVLDMGSTLCRSSTQRNSRNHYCDLAECQSARNARNQRAFRDRHAIAKAQAEKKGRE